LLLCKICTVTQFYNLVIYIDRGHIQSCFIFALWLIMSNINIYLTFLNLLCIYFSSINGKKHYFFIIKIRGKNIFQLKKTNHTPAYCIQFHDIVILYCTLLGIEFVKLSTFNIDFWICIVAITILRIWRLTIWQSHQKNKVWYQEIWFLVYFLPMYVCRSLRLTIVGLILNHMAYKV